MFWRSCGRKSYSGSSCGPFSLRFRDSIWLRGGVEQSVRTVAESSGCIPCLGEPVASQVDPSRASWVAYRLWTSQPFDANARHCPNSAQIHCPVQSSREAQYVLGRHGRTKLLLSDFFRFNMYPLKGSRTFYSLLRKEHYCYCHQYMDFNYLEMKPCPRWISGTNRDPKRYWNLASRFRWLDLTHSMDSQTSDLLVVLEVKKA